MEPDLQLKEDLLLILIFKLHLNKFILCVDGGSCHGMCTEIRSWFSLLRIGLQELKTVKLGGGHLCLPLNALKAH